MIVYVHGYQIENLVTKIKKTATQYLSLNTFACISESVFWESWMHLHHL